MSQPIHHQARIEGFRSAILSFIEARRDAKLNGAVDRSDISAKYEYNVWLADAVRRVEQIQLVTHVGKGAHPNAGGSSIYARPSDLPVHSEIGSHSLGVVYAEDVVGNAAALDVFKFLKIEVYGRALEEWAREEDENFRDALHPDPIIAATWMRAFGGLIRTDEKPKSHELAKQVYWLIGEAAIDNEEFHLLQPMFPSSLLHAVHANIQEVRFGEPNKLARDAFRRGEPFDAPYYNYRGLAVRKLGGSKPQNVSQLNSERRGVNYLLASLPPQWSTVRTHQLMRTKSALDRFIYFQSVREHLGRLSALLLSDSPANDSTRRARDRILQDLCLQLLMFAAEVARQYAPGWTRSEECILPLYEKVWLDPERLGLDDRENPDQRLEDQEFKQNYHSGDWPNNVADRFAGLVNKYLNEKGLVAVGDAEFRYFANQVLVDAAWPTPMQNRMTKEKASHG